MMAISRDTACRAGMAPNPISGDNGVPTETEDDRKRRIAWDAKMIAEGLALIDKAVRHRQPGPYQIQAAIAATRTAGP